MLRRVFSAAAVLFLLTLPAQADEWEKTFQVTGAPQVRVRSGDGHIRVNTWNRQEVHARVVTEGWRIADDEVRITANQDGNAVEIEVRVPRMQWNFGYHRRTINVELMLPAEASLSARTSDGHISVSSLTGSLDLQTSDGRISLRGVRGEMRLHTSDGRIEGDSLDGRLVAETSDGRITVSGRFDLLDLRTSDGSIDAQVRPGSRVTAPWSVRTSDGNVTLHLPGELDADLDAHAQDGRISFGFPITVSGELSRSRIHAKLNAGGPPLRVRTSDGNIQVDRL